MSLWDQLSYESIPCCGSSKYLFVNDVMLYTPSTTFQGFRLYGGHISNNCLRVELSLMQLINLTSVMLYTAHEVRIWELNDDEITVGISIIWECGLVGQSPQQHFSNVAYNADTRWKVPAFQQLIEDANFSSCLLAESFTYSTTVSPTHTSNIFTKLSLYQLMVVIRTDQIWCRKNECEIYNLSRLKSM